MLISSQELQIGQFVRSRAGRDKGNVYIVYRIIDDRYVNVIDGDRRKLSNPKKKKVIHLVKFGDFNQTIQDEMMHQEMLNDAWIRKAILNQVRLGRDDSNG